MAESQETAILIPRQVKSKLGDLTVDASISEAHTTTIQTTDYPIEDGANIPDHAVVQPDQLTMDVMWTDIQPDGAVLGRAREQWEALVSLAKARTAITVVSGLRVYPSMIITQVGTIEDASSGYALGVQVQLKELQIAERRTTLISPDPAVSHGAKKPKGKGAKKATQDAKEKAKLESSQLYNLIFGG